MSNGKTSFRIRSDVGIGGQYPLLIIAGPCVIESEELCTEIAHKMQESCRKFGLGYVFKASFDKANRTSLESFRGPGREEGLRILHDIRERFDVPVLTDVHEPSQPSDVARIADIIQVPAFLCRQTDLLLAAGESDAVVNVKKGQFCAPELMKSAADKVTSTGNQRIMLTERGTFFGYNNLVVDMRNLVIMREQGVPVVFDATHPVQLPGGRKDASGGQREFVPPLCRASAAVGIDALFLEAHPRPEKALSDASTSLPLEQINPILEQVQVLHGTV